MSEAGQAPGGVRVVSGTLVRKPARGARRRATAVVEKAEPVRRPAKVARMLALAHHLQDAIDRGVVADRAAVAAKLGLTRARVTQLLGLLLLAPDLQVAVLSMEAVDGVEPMAERALRAVVAVAWWTRQREAFQWMSPAAIASASRGTMITDPRSSVPNGRPPPRALDLHDRLGNRKADDRARRA